MNEVKKYAAVGNDCNNNNSNYFQITILHILTSYFYMKQMHVFFIYKWESVINKV